MNYKLSYYTIFSEPVNSSNDIILFSTRSSQAVKIKERVKDLLLENNIEEIEEKIKERLIAIKAIVATDEQELFNIVDENTKAIQASTELYEVIQPSAMCQLGCDYCGQEHTKDYIPATVYAKLLERIELKITTGNYKSLYIGWFGGEPLMGLKQIREISKELKEMAARHSLGYGAKIVTNGLSLKPAIFKELAEEMSVKQVEITLDGTAIFHDQRRITKEKHPTFDIIFNNILDITNMPEYDSLDCRISLRCNVDHRNVEGVSPLIQLLAEHKLQSKLAYFYPIGVYSWGGNDAHQKSLTKEEFAALEIGWMIEMFEHGFTPSLLPGRVRKVCMAVSKDSEMYDAFGNIFNCTEVSYSSHYKGTSYVLGNLKLDNKYIEKNRPLNTWYEDMKDNRFPCATCKMLPVCGGGCPKSWHEDMRACPSAKFNIKDRLALTYVAAKSNMKTPELLETSV